MVLTLHLKYFSAAIRACKANREALVITTSFSDTDDVFRLLHLTVVALFSEQIQKDLAVLKAGKPSDVSLAAKWAPTPGSKPPSHCHELLTHCLLNAAPTTHCCSAACISECSLRLTQHVRACARVCVCVRACVCVCDLCVICV